MMHELKLFYAPGSCSRATLICLEETGARYTPELISFMRRENRTPEFLALNPKGKIPVLVVDETPLTETVAIVHWLSATYPDAALLPKPATAIGQAKVLSDLAWISSALHALIARLRFPMMFTTVADAYPSLREGAAKGLHEAFGMIEKRIAERGWWHGAWSAQDAYLYWVWTRAADGGFPCTDYAAFTAHKSRMDERVSTTAALTIEAEGERRLAAIGATLTV